MMILLLLFTHLVSGSLREMTVEVSSKTEECFFTPITSLSPLVAEYKVQKYKEASEEILYLQNKLKATNMKDSSMADAKLAPSSSS